MGVIHQMTEQAFLDLAARDDDGQWELWDGEPRAKPGMSYRHNQYTFELAYDLRRQLDPMRHQVRVNMGHLRRSERHYFIPDVAVIPAALAQEQERLDQPGRLEAYDAPLPLVVEVWSRSTGEYDLSVKLAAYQARGDQEIWSLHPYRRELTRWVRRPDGRYAESVHTGGAVALAALPGVVVDLDALFGE